MRHLIVAVAAVASLACCATARADSYVVLYKQSAVPASARADVEKAGGSLVYAYDQIGVAIARSDSGAFAGALAKDSRVDGVASTAGLSSRVSEPAAGGAIGGLPNAPASDSDSLS